MIDGKEKKVTLKISDGRIHEKGERQIKHYTKKDSLGESHE